MTTEELQQLVAELVEVQKRNEEERLRNEEERRSEEAKVRQAFEETNRVLQETGRYVREIGRQIGALGEKFGSFTEGMAFPSMRKLLQERFHMDVVSPRVLSRLNGRSLELDVLAYSKAPTDEVYVV